VEASREGCEGCEENSPFVSFVLFARSFRRRFHLSKSARGRILEFALRE
jgi:hypothetical protein